MKSTSSSVLSKDGVSSGMAFGGRARFCTRTEGTVGARRFFDPPTELMDPMEPIDVAAEIMLILSELSTTLAECRGGAQSSCPPGMLIMEDAVVVGRFVIDIDFVGGMPPATSELLPLDMCPL